jgi:hypothetical protein
MHNLLNSLIALFSIKQDSSLTPCDFKKKSYNELQLVLHNTLNSIGLKPHTTKHIFPCNKGEEVSIDEVFLINGCKVTVGLHNPNNSLLTLKLSGRKAIVERYFHNISNSSQILLENHGIVLEAFFDEKEKNNSELIINQFVSPITDIAITIRDTMKCIK